METTYRLKIQSGPEIGKEFTLDKPELFLGRDPGNDIEIADPEVSRRHARFVLTGTNYSVEDLGSTNGTLVRGIKVQTLTPLTSGDVIAIGERVSLVYQAVLFDPEATVAVPRRVGYPPEPIPSEPLIQRPPIKIEPQAPLTPAPIQPAPVISAPEQKAQPVVPPFIPEPEEVKESPVEAEPAEPEPAFAGKTPAQPKAPRKRSAWVGILLIIGLLILIFCVIPWIIIDITNSYCLFLPGILNAIQPGVCP